MRILPIQIHNKNIYDLNHKTSFCAAKTQPDNRVIMGIYGDLGIQATQNRDGEITLSHYATPAYNTKWKEHGLTEDNYESKLLENVLQIKKNATFRNRNNLILPKLKEIGGNLTVENTWKECTPNGGMANMVAATTFPLLESTGGFDLCDAYWEDFHLEKHYPSLKTIKGRAIVPLDSLITINHFHNINVYSDIINVWDGDFEFQYQ